MRLIFMVAMCYAVQMQWRCPTVDVVLSSGFMCFASHAGFLDALEAHGIRPSALVGTSCGALAASLLAAGHSASDVADEFSARAPIWDCRPGLPQGLMSLALLQDRLSLLLPPTFADLPVPLAIGVCGATDHAPELITKGDLPAAVAASCAIPGVFSPVRVGRRRYVDGASSDRTFLRKWRQWRGGVAVVHLVKNDGAAIGPRDGVRQEASDIVLVRTPRTKSAGLFTLGNFDDERALSRDLAYDQLRDHMPRLLMRNGASSYY